MKRLRTESFRESECTLNRNSVALLSISISLLFACALSTNAADRIIVPASSVVRPADAEIRAHTNLIIYLPNGDRTGPGSTSETPASIACIYDLVPRVKGCPIAGTTVNPSGGARAIAIVDAFDDPNAASDLTTFSNQFGLPPANFSVVYAAGVEPPPDPTGDWEVEESLDIEWAHAMAPNATIYLVEATTDLTSDLYAAESVATSLVQAAGGGEVSNSWGGSESSDENTEDYLFQNKGVVYLASAGDTAGQVEYPSASPYVVSAGGTTIHRGSAGNYLFQSGWNGCNGGAGGGPSQYEPRPDYQNKIKKVVGDSRGTPDISFDANPCSGVAVYDTWPYEGEILDWVQVGGTSVSSPSLAGILNAAGGFSSSSGAELVAMYRELGNKSDFTDITRGNNTYSCKKGWDFCTGLGTVWTYAGK